MFVHLAIHYPRPEYIDDVLASMARVNEAAEGAPGLIQMGAWRDQNSNRLVGLAVWESPAAFEAAAERILRVVEDDPWDQWCERPIDVFYLTRPLLSATSSHSSSSHHFWSFLCPICPSSRDGK